MIILSRIYGYSTISTSEAAYIIGGAYTREIIAVFENDAWSQAGQLTSPGRAFHGSIWLENHDTIIIIGGHPFDGRLVFLKNLFIINGFFSDFETEMDKDYYYGIGLHLVPFDFCT